MAANMTLTSVSVISRKAIRYFIYIIGGFLFLRFTVLSGINIYEKLQSKKPEAPTIKFGKLTTIPWNTNNNPTDLTYTLNTVSGGLPNFPSQAKIYLIPRPLSSINAVDKAKHIAKDLGFSGQPNELVETVYQFSQGNSVLNMNIVTGAFSISFDVNSNPQIINSLPPSSQAAVNKAKDILNNAGLTRDIGPASTKFLRVEGGELVEAIAQSEANLTQVSLFRKDFGTPESKLPNVTLDPEKGNIWFLLSGSETKIIAGEYHYFPVDKETFATYPIKTAQIAWEDLKAGKGYIASLGDNEKNISITEVVLAYFDPADYTEFYQPVIVFKGDNGFVAYVPAATDEFYEK